MLILEAMPTTPTPQFNIDDVVQLLNSINTKLNDIEHLSQRLSEIQVSISTCHNYITSLVADNGTWIIGIFAVCFISLMVRLIWK